MTLPPLLAFEDDIPVKAIFWVIVLILWGASSAVAALKKAVKAQTPPRVPLVPPLAGKGIQSLPSSLSPSPKKTNPTPGVRLTPVPFRPVTSSTRVIPQALRTPMLTPPTQAAFKVPPRPAAPPPLPPPVRAGFLRTAPPLEATRIVQDSTATNVRRLLRPGTLREQWVVMELLGKPLALRDERVV